VWTTGWQRGVAARVKDGTGRAKILVALTAVGVLAFLVVAMGWGSFEVEILAAALVVVVIPLVVTATTSYDEEENTRGLTVWSIDAAKRMFKGGRTPNEFGGEPVPVSWKLIDDDGEGRIYLSAEDMETLEASPGDLVYLCDRRGWLGGLKSIHSVFGEPHDEPGVVFVNEDQVEHGLFAEGRPLVATKEM